MTARSLWNQNVLQSFANLLTNGDTVRSGWIFSIQGLTLVVASFPIMWASDVWSREGVLKASVVIGAPAFGMLSYASIVER